MSGTADDVEGWKDLGQPPAALPGITPHASAQDGDPRQPLVLVPVQPLAVQAARDLPGHRWRPLDSPPPAPLRTGTGGPCLDHRHHGLPDGYRPHDYRRRRVVPAGRQGQRVRPATRLCLPGQTGAVAHDRYETVERGHGRLERRTCTTMGGPHGILEGIDSDQRWAVPCAAARLMWTSTGRSTARTRQSLRRHRGPSHPSVHAVEGRREPCRDRIGHLLNPPQRMDPRPRSPGPRWPACCVGIGTTAHRELLRCQGCLLPNQPRFIHGSDAYSSIWQRRVGAGTVSVSLSWVRLGKDKGALVADCIPAPIRPAGPRTMFPDRPRPASTPSHRRQGRPRCASAPPSETHGRCPCIRTGDRTGAKPSPGEHGWALRSSRTTIGDTLTRACVPL